MVQTNILVNNSKEEYITFGGYSKRGEIIGNKFQCKMVAFYLFENNGNHIFFIASDWHFGSEPWDLNQDKVYADFKDVTKEIIEEMIEDKIIDEPPEEFNRYFK